MSATSTIASRATATATSTNVVLTTPQLNTLNDIAKGSGTVGILGVLAFFALFLSTPKSLETPTGRLLFALGCVDLVDSISKFVGRWSIPGSGDTSAVSCQLQAAAIQWNILASALIVLSMALNALYIVYFKGTTENIRKAEPFVIAACLLIPLPMAIAPAFLTLQDSNGRTLRVYGAAGQWCWYNSGFKDFILYSWFMLLWIIFLFNVIAFVLVVSALQSSAGIFAGMQSIKTSRNRMFIAERMLAYLVAFTIVWLPSNINRINTLVTNDQNFVLSVLQTLVSPARGFFDFLAYFFTWYRQKTLLAARNNSKSQLQTKSSEGFSSQKSGDAINQGGDNVSPSAPSE